MGRPGQLRPPRAPRRRSPGGRRRRWSGPRILAHHLPDRDPASTAAIVASSCGLGERLAELTGDGSMKEILVHSEDGYVVIYRVGTVGVLTVLTSPAVNLAMLKLKARDVVNRLAGS